MGHSRLGLLPRTASWRKVIDLIAEDGDAAEVAHATLEAARREFYEAGDDPGVVYVVWLLTQLPIAARAENPAEQLRELGLELSPQSTALEFSTAFGEAVEDHFYDMESPHSDVAEMARLSAIKTLYDTLEGPSSDLFDRGAALAAGLSDLSTVARFGALSRAFFANLTERVLGYYVSRELPVHVGGEHRFSNVQEQSSFEEALALRARQASLIVEQFSGEWYSLAKFRNDVTQERTAKFVSKALRKLRAELGRDVG
ncbi:MAG: hypothetical protein H6740_14870 [Alphaproteobacteria bacterium]|nr:hypothetical protein [Alphaproteobacteria bacterium]